MLNDYQQTIKELERIKSSSKKEILNINAFLEKLESFKLDALRLKNEHYITINQINQLENKFKKKIKKDIKYYYSN